jgi:hypothetical protein
MMKMTTNKQYMKNKINRIFKIKNIIKENKMISSKNLVKI